MKFNPRHKMLGAVGASVSGTKVAVTNHLEDVFFVQHLINRGMHAVPDFRPLREDGRCGPKTIAAITEFQRKFVSKISSDGRVDLNGATLRALMAGQTSAAVAAKSVAQPANPERAFPAHVVAFIQEHASAGQAAAKVWSTRYCWRRRRTNPPGVGT